MINHNTRRAHVATVDLGFKQIEGLMLPDGSFAVGVSQLAELFSIPQKNSSRDIKGLLGDRINLRKISTQLNNRKVNVVTVGEFMDILVALAMKGNSVAMDLVVQHPKYFSADVIGAVKSMVRQARKAINPVEKQIQARLHAKLGGETEVLTPVGRIDLLTSTEIIEIKSSRLWKSGLGQLLVYGGYYPSHQKRLHLFGGTHSEMKELISLHCTKFQVKPTWE